MKPVDLEYTDIVDAYQAAETFTSLGFEVTKPLEVAGKFCIRVQE